MVIGIGTDLVQISRIRRAMDTLAPGALARMFTAAELAVAKEKAKPEEYLATRFACKEAVFKALAPHTAKNGFDLRIVETLNHPDGSPYIHITDPLQAVMQEAGVRQILVSITTEADLAQAFVVCTDQEPAY